MFKTTPFIQKSFLICSFILVLFAVYSIRGNTNEVSDGGYNTQTCDANGNCISMPDSKLPRHANEQGKPPEVNLSQCYDRHGSCKDFLSHGL